MSDKAKAFVEELMGDLDDRSGFDMGGLDEEVVAEWRTKWEGMAERALSAARAEGYAKAREQAAKVVEAEARVIGAKGLLGAATTGYVAAIRAMQDERAVCPGCVMCSTNEQHACPDDAVRR